MQQQQKETCGSDQCSDTCNDVQTINKKICKKCKENKSVIMLGKDPTCLDCFYSFIEHSFKMTLRMKCNMMEKNEKILLCVSSGQNSACLAKLASDAIYQTGHANKNKMFLEAEVLHINESFIWSSFGLKVSTTKQLQNFIENECKFKYHETNIEDIYDSNQPKENLIQLLKSIPEYGSAREDFIWYIKQYLILQYAEKLNIKRVVLGSNGQRMVSSVFASLAKGKGMSLVSETSYSTQILSMNINRPLRDLLYKWILYYLHVKKINDHLEFSLEQHLKFLVTTNITKNKPASGNIDHLLDDFIDKLQNGFTATVTTVLQTATKAKMKTPLSTKRCPICLSPQEYTMNKLEIETLDQSTQTDLQIYEKETRYYNQLCLSCKRIILGSTAKQQLFNLDEMLIPKCISDFALTQE